MNTSCGDTVKCRLDAGKSPIFRSQSPCTDISVRKSQRVTIFVRIYPYKSLKGLKVGNRTRFCRNSQSLGGPYLPHHWSDWPKILDLVLWVPKQHVYQVSLKSETVGFKFSVILGDLTRNDPEVNIFMTQNNMFPAYTKVNQAKLIFIFTSRLSPVL